MTLHVCQKVGVALLVGQRSCDEKHRQRECLENEESGPQTGYGGEKKHIEKPIPQAGVKGQRSELFRQGVGSESGGCDKTID